MQTNLEPLKRSDFETMLEVHSGCCIFSTALEHIKNERELICVLGRYISLNSVFGSGVASLAGQIGSRQDLFRDTEEPLAVAADRSVEVAAAIFLAATAEFGEPGRSTHRRLAQATLKAVATFWGFTSADLDGPACMNRTTQTAIERVLEGYCVNQPANDEKIFRSIGFHIGSEMLADEEFNLLDSFLQIHYSDLVHHLRNTKSETAGVKNSAYDWIRIHISVEADHFSAAVVAANRALCYYAGTESNAQVRDWILDGVKQFATVQENFMTGLLDNLETGENPSIRTRPPG